MQFFSCMAAKYRDVLLGLRLPNGRLQIIDALIAVESYDEGVGKLRGDLLEGLLYFGIVGRTAVCVAVERADVVGNSRATSPSVARRWVPTACQR